MPDDDFTREIKPETSPAAGEKPAEKKTIPPAPGSELFPPVENESIPAASPTDKNQLGEKLDTAGNSAFTTAGAPENGIKRGRGRPRKDGAPKKSDLVIPPLESEDDDFQPGREIPADPVAEFNQKVNTLLRKCISGSARGITDGCELITRSLADKAKIDPDFTDRTLASAKPDKDALDDFSASVDLVLDKHAPAVKEGGEWYCLGLSFARLTAPYAVVWLEFKREIARQRAKEKK